MESSESIGKSCFPYASPIVIAHKNGSIRLCITYRQLNNRTTRDAYPLLCMEEALDALGDAQFFSTLDLTSGYWQVEVEEVDKPKTAFSTPMGLCNRMPFSGFQPPKCTCHLPTTYANMSRWLELFNSPTVLRWHHSILLNFWRTPRPPWKSVYISTRTRPET